MKAILCGLVWIMAATSVWGDVIELKSGEKVEGKLLVSTDEKVVMMIQVSPTIHDERVILRSEIAKMNVAGPDDTAFTAIKNLRPAATVLSLDYYDTVITKQIEPFLSEYAYSRHLPEVRKIREAFEKEKVRMENSGEIKFEGAWLTKEDYEKDRLQIDAAITLEKMQAAVERENYPQALNLYEKMKADYAKSSSYPEALALAQVSMEKLDKLIAALLVKLTLDEQKREEKIVISTQTDQQQIRQAIAREKASIDAAIENARKAGVVYPPIYTNHRDSLLSLQQSVQAGVKEINSASVAVMQQSVQLTRNAQVDMDAFEIARAEANLQEAKKLWADNALVSTMEERLKQRKAELDKANKEQQEALKRTITAETPKK